MTWLVDAGLAAKTWLGTLGVMALHGTLLAIIAVLLARAGRVRPSWQAAIWLVVTIKLAVPWGPQMPWSFADLLAQLTSSSSDASPLTIVHKGLPAAAVRAEAWPAIGYVALATVWLAGALIVFVSALVASRRTHRAAQAAVPAPADAISLLAELAARSRVHAPALRVGIADIGPHVVGMRRPIIVVPPALLTDHSLLAAALLHELAHVRRRDVLARIIQIVASSLMWWFPVARSVRRRLELAREAACDAWALEAGELERPAYARLLVRMAALRDAAAPALVARTQLDARVAAVLGPVTRARLSWLHRGALVAWLVIALGGARTASARPRVEVCQYSPEMATALYSAYPEADLDGDGELSRDEACDLRAQLASDDELTSRLSPEAEAELATLASEPLCCNCDGPEVYSVPEISSCQTVPGVDR